MPFFAGTVNRRKLCTIWVIHSFSSAENPLSFRQKRCLSEGIFLVDGNSPTILDSTKAEQNTTDETSAVRFVCFTGGG